MTKSTSTRRCRTSAHHSLHEKDALYHATQITTTMNMTIKINMNASTRHDTPSHERRDEEDRYPIRRAALLPHCSSLPTGCFGQMPFSTLRLLRLKCLPKREKGEELVSVAERSAIRAIGKEIDHRHCGPLPAMTLMLLVPWPDSPSSRRWFASPKGDVTPCSSIPYKASRKPTGISPISPG